MALLRIALSTIVTAALAACAHSTAAPVPVQAKEPVAMNASSAGTSMPRTTGEYPDLTPEKVGRRVLKLLGDLDSFSELTSERVRKVMQLPMTDASKLNGGYLTMAHSGGQWEYNFSYRIDVKYPAFTNVKFEVTKGFEGVTAAPKCRLAFNAYVSELKRIGFIEREDMAQFETPQPLALYDPVTGQEIGGTRAASSRLPGYFYMRKDIIVAVREDRKINAAGDEAGHACIYEIAVFGNGF